MQEGVPVQAHQQPQAGAGPAPWARAGAVPAPWARAGSRLSWGAVTGQPPAAECCREEGCLRWHLTGGEENVSGEAGRGKLRPFSETRE